jgi:hypothetical protein
MIKENRPSRAQDSPADVRAREVEMRMTDDERFSLVVSVMGENPVIPLTRERISEGTPMSAGYDLMSVSDSLSDMNAVI